MEQKLHISASPHIRANITTRRIMLDVLIALSPAALAGCFIFGIGALAVISVCILTCVLGEFVFNLIIKKEQTIGDLSAAVTGLILALNLPADIPLWQASIGSLFAIILVKCIFGGIGCNVVNPAATARVFMLIAFTSVAKPSFPIADTVSTATPLAELAAGNEVKLLPLLLGTTGGAIGETCAVAIIAGFVYLLVRRVITWQIPVVFVSSVFVLSFLLGGMDVMNALYWTLSGGLLFGAVFMATDYVTSPSTVWGKVVFGFGAGLITVIIRFYGAYPEGVSIAILFMNIVNPYIETLTRRRVFGGKRA